MLNKELDKLCRTALGKPPQAIETPGGKGRKTIVVIVDGQRYVISKRHSRGRAELEAEVLRQLKPTGLVPALVHLEGKYLIQEYIEGPRLSEALDRLAPTQPKRLLAQAVDSLFELQGCASKTGLSKAAPPIGRRAGWLDDFLSVPHLLAEQLSITAPTFDRKATQKIITVNHPVFIKWDARPGNAILRADGTLCWFDWEHSGCREPVDDMVWLLADEWSPECPITEDYVINRLQQDQNIPREHAAIRFYTMGVLHSFVRLSLIFARYHKTGVWHDHAACLKHDRIGVTPAHVKHLSMRAVRWANMAKTLDPLIATLNEISTLKLE